MDLKRAGQRPVQYAWTQAWLRELPDHGLVVLILHEGGGRQARTVVARRLRGRGGRSGECRTHLRRVGVGDVSEGCVIGLHPGNRSEVGIDPERVRDAAASIAVGGVVEVVAFVSAAPSSVAYGPMSACVITFWTVAVKPARLASLMT